MASTRPVIGGFAMSIQHDLERYRRERAAERSLEIAEDSLGQRERLIAEIGRQSAHLLRDTEALVATTSRSAGAAEDVADEISRMAATADWALPSIVEHLAATAERLGGVEQMLASPTETASAELYRRGSYALTSGWLEEAEADLSAAVDIYPYNPRTWFNLGVARQRAGSGHAAVEAYSRCARYAAPSDAALTARAVLLAAFLHRSERRPNASADILRDYADRLNRCAELHLAAGVHHNDHDHLVRALALAPEMAADARAAGASGLDAAARAVVEMSDGPVYRLRAIERLAAELVAAAHLAGLVNVGAVPSPQDLPADSVEALLLAHRAVPNAVDVIKRLSAEIRAEYDRQQAVADAAVGDRDRARAEAIRAVRTAQDCEAFASGLAADVEGAHHLIYQAVHRTEEAHLSVPVARQRASEARIRAEQAKEQATRAKEQVAPAQDQVRQAEKQVREAEQRVRQVMRAERQAGYGRDYAEQQARRARDHAEQLAVKVQELPSRPNKTVATSVSWEGQEEEAKKQAHLAEQSAEHARTQATHAKEQTELATFQATQAKENAERSKEQVRQAKQQAGEDRHRAKLADEEYANAERLVQDAQAPGILAERARRLADQAWQRADDFVDRLTHVDDARQRLRRMRLQFEAEIENDRLQALQGELAGMIVDFARQWAHEAQEQSDAATRVAEEAASAAVEAARLVSIAQATSQIAQDSGVAPDRIVPFDTPDQWRNLAG
jgi:hypothetical protein